jgi:hypothetical protein
MTSPARPASHQTPERLLSISELAEYLGVPMPRSIAGATRARDPSVTASDATSATGSATSNAGLKPNGMSAPVRKVGA